MLKCSGCLANISSDDPELSLPPPSLCKFSTELVAARPSATGHFPCFHYPISTPPPFIFPLPIVATCTVCCYCLQIIMIATKRHGLKYRHLQQIVASDRTIPFPRLLFGGWSREPWKIMAVDFSAEEGGWV